MLIFKDADAIAEEVIARVGRRIVLALPLGLGKANLIANALYARAVADPSIHLRIFTALTLEKPRYANLLERRFLAPVIERLFGAWPELDYAKALRSGTLPRNVDVNEFFLLAGRWLNVRRAQQGYISSNYAQATPLLLSLGINVVAQLVARRGDRLSLSCNTDMTLELLAARREGRADFLLVGEESDELPFMPGEGDVGEEVFHALLDGDRYPLFAPPNEPIDDAEYAIGFHVARTVKDGGTLQIGIGQEGDATVHALTLRQHDNAAYREALARLCTIEDRFHECEPFREGLYACTEMFVDAFLKLIEAGILTREVDGAVLHAAFFLGPKSFYRALNAMSDAMRARLKMTAVSFTNTLYGNEEAKRLARMHSRFVNQAMMATLLGSAVSDGLDDGRVVSGVGGQHDFVTQAFALEDAHSILTLKAARTKRRRTSSNILWHYGHETIPRHLRDVYVTEYGIADLRGKSDAECIAAMLAIADSRFQPALLDQAHAAGKIDSHYEIPAAQRNNTPARIAEALAPLKARGLLPPFPLGTDFDQAEQQLLPALETLAEASPLALARHALRGSLLAPRAGEKELLARMRLNAPHTLEERLSRALLRSALAS